MDIFVHAANILFLISFLVRDILWLRLMSVIGGFALIPYYVYGNDPPLWSPLFWNCLFMTINAVQIYRLVRERRPVRFTEAERQLYETIFHSLSPRAFAKLLALADWRDATEETRLLEQGLPLTELLLICDGRVAVRVGDAEVARLDGGRFVGEMSFLTGEDTCASVWAVRPTRYVAWSRDKLDAFLQDNPEVRAGLQLILGTDLANKLRAA